MPRVWTLKKDVAVQPPMQTDLAIHTYESSKVKSDADTIDPSGSKQLKKLNNADVLKQEV